MTLSRDDLEDGQGIALGRDASFVIQTIGLGKAYYPSASPGAALISALRGTVSQSTPFWALNPVDLKVKRGEVVGLVGSNGAGKSTLLQIISGTLAPSTGQLWVTGRVAALLELGAGFNPDFTGRENLLLNGPLLGLSRQQLADRLEEIIAFSGIGAFIDRPVKTYSSGMFVRLAFSLATSVEPDILVIDEALSVGDGEFARKSFDRILGLRDSGTTIFFCSHSMYQIESLCTQALWLDHGQLRMFGAPAEVTAAYQEHLDQLSAPPPPADASLPAVPLVTSPGHARIRSLDFASDGIHGTSLQAMSGRSDIDITIGFESDPGLPTPHAAVTLNSADGRILASSGTWIDGVTLKRDPAGRGTVTIRFPAIPMLKGRYSLDAYLFCERGLHIYSAAEKFATLTIEQSHLEQGIVSLPHRWRAEAGSLLTTYPDSAVEAPSPPLALPSNWTPKFTTSWSRETDKQGLLNLFSQAFLDDMPPKRWDWKYRQAPVWGITVRRDDQYAAFFGGMPRAMVHDGKTVLAVQIGDVMVLPEHRGALARTGPLFRSAAAYFANMHTLYPEARMGFGFPSLRHMSLGIKLGLYLEVDTISTLRWPVLTPVRSALTKTRVLQHLSGAAESTRLNQLWHDMQQDWPGLLLPVRDAARWNYRYVEHPEFSYRVLMVSNRWTGKPLAAVVLRAHPDHLEWLDYAGSREAIPLALRAARMHAAELGLAHVKGWFSSALVDEFSQGQAALEPNDIRVPVNLWGRDVDQAKPIAPLWLMAGDTDFR
jgi:ABC-type polysaccharide/polyol phosphate transport system ATPase subunit